jgi:hypothetical protein
MSARRTLIFAVVAAWLLEHFVPFGRLVLYPFTLLATWVHETGHGLAAIATGGRFDKLVIYADASGYASAAVVPGWREAVMAAGGLWAPPIVGAALLILSRGARRTRVTLLALALAMLTTLAFWVRSPAGFVAVPLTAALIAFVAWRGSDRERVWFSQFIAVTLALDTLGRMVGYALSATAHVGGRDEKSDVVRIADALGGHYVVWGLVVIAVALTLLALGLWAAWRAPRKSGPTSHRAPASRRA